ncbi:hypothetical protein DXG01_007734, partial [Tephrocybe rancida]
VRIAWGGPEEKQAEFDKGNFDAKDWVNEARKIVEASLESYWATHPTRTATAAKSAPHTPATEDSFTSKYDRHCCTLLTQKGDDGWQTELLRYLKDVPEDVDSDTDIIAWWLVHARIYPTIAQMALDVLPCQASSVTCECLFSSTKLTATNHCARLRPELFEKLQILKHIWCPELVDAARVTSEDVDCITLETYKSLLVADIELNNWDNELS